MLGVHGAVEVVALGVVAADVLQETHLLLRLGAFGDDAQVHEAGHGHDGLEDALAASRVVVAVQEAHVDLEYVDGDVLQHVER